MATTASAKPGDRIKALIGKLKHEPTPAVAQDKPEAAPVRHSVLVPRRRSAVHEVQPAAPSVPAPTAPAEAPAEKTTAKPMAYHHAASCVLVSTKAAPQFNLRDVADILAVYSKASTQEKLAAELEGSAKKCATEDRPYLVELAKCVRGNLELKTCHCQSGGKCTCGPNCKCGAK